MVTTFTEDLPAAVVDQIVSDIFAGLLDAYDLYAAPAPHDDAVLAVSGSVSMTGEWPGHISVACSDAFATRFAARLLQLPVDAVAVEDVLDAIGEFANVVGGNVKAVVPGPNALSLPRVVRGSEFLPAAVEIVRLDLLWADEPLRVLVWAGPRSEGDTR